MTKPEIEAKIIAAKADKYMSESLKAKYISQMEALLNAPEKKADEPVKNKLQASAKPTKTKSVPKRWPAEYDKKFDKHIQSMKQNKPAYNCDELISKAKERAAKAKTRAKAAPKTEATKIKQVIVKLEDRVDNKVDKMSRAELTKLIAETRAFLNQLKGAMFRRFKV